jgi:hypothetical protein
MGAGWHERGGREEKVEFKLPEGSIATTCMIG